MTKERHNLEKPITLWLATDWHTEIWQNKGATQVPAGCRTFTINNHVPRIPRIRSYKGVTTGKMMDGRSTWERDKCHEWGGRMQGGGGEAGPDLQETPEGDTRHLMGDEKKWTVP